MAKMNLQGSVSTRPLLELFVYILTILTQAQRDEKKGTGCQRRDLLRAELGLGWGVGGRLGRKEESAREEIRGGGLRTYHRESMAV